MSFGQRFPGTNKTNYMTKKVLLSFLTLFISLLSFAQQPINLSGTIKDTTSGNFVKNASCGAFTKRLLAHKVCKDQF